MYIFLKSNVYYREQYKEFFLLFLFSCLVVVVLQDHCAMFLYTFLFMFLLMLLFGAGARSSCSSSSEVTTEIILY